jgi:hypothetical protein
MNKLLLFIFLGVCVSAADKPLPVNLDRVECRGRIESFEKQGMEILPADSSPCVWFDITWTTIEAPEEYAGLRHKLLSHDDAPTSPYGKVGDVISFSDSKSWLEFEKHPEKSRIDAKELMKSFGDEKKPKKAEKTPNQALQHNDPSCHVSCLRTPRASWGRG